MGLLFPSVPSFSSPLLFLVFRGFFSSHFLLFWGDAGVSGYIYAFRTWRRFSNLEAAFLLIQV